MRAKIISFWFFPLALAAGASAQEKPSLTQLGQLESSPAAVRQVPDAAVPALPAAPEKAPIKNFGVAAWKILDRDRREAQLFRGGELKDEASLKYLRGLGVDTVISLRAMHDLDEKLCAAHNINCLEYGVVPVPGMGLARSKSFRKAFSRVVAEMKAGHKVFIYCQGGRHRTSAVVAAITVRETACGKTFNRTELSASLAKMLEDYGFHNSNGKAFFTAWEKEMRGWAENFEENQWLCE